MRVTLRPGNAVTLKDVAAGGALVHSARPLRPGGRIHVSIATATRSLSLPAHIVRCVVVAIDATAGVVYAGALRFEVRCELPWERETLGG